MQRKVTNDDFLEAFGKPTENGMKKVYLLLVIASALTLSSCSSVEFVSLANNSIAPPMDVNKLIYDSPPRFIDRTVDDLTLPAGLLSRLTFNDKVMITSIDSVNHIQSSAYAVVDRGLIQKLLSKNLIVVERKEHLVGRVLAESSADQDNLWRYYVSPADDSNLVLRSSNQFIYPTKILAYRVLDLGITQSINQTNLDVYRTGVAELELRLIDVPTSRILFSGIATEINQDTVSDSEFQLLSRLHFTCYPDDFSAMSANRSSHSPKGFLSGQGIAVGSITFLFTEGAQVAFAYVKGAYTNQLIKTIKIPGDQPGSAFIYKWDLKDDNGNQIKSGPYAMFLGGVQVADFNVGG